MINVKDNYWIPSEGFAYITNGSVWTDGIYLGSADSIENWHDTNEEPVEPIEEPAPTADDYEAALARLGVDI